MTVSVTTARPGHWDTPLGSYDFRHIRPGLLRGYRLIEVSPAQRAFVASPEKALLDLVYLQANGDSLDYLRELRLQNVERLDCEEVRRQADLSQSPKLQRTAQLIASLVRAEALEYETL